MSSCWRHSSESVTRHKLMVWQSHCCGRATGLAHWAPQGTVAWNDSFFFSSRRRHTSCLSDWSSDVCSSDLGVAAYPLGMSRIADPSLAPDGHARIAWAAQHMPVLEALHDRLDDGALRGRKLAVVVDRKSVV